MKKLEKLWQYTKDNKWFILVMLIGSISFIAQMREVVLYADDFSLGLISQKGIVAILKHLKNNYLNWGGGLTCLFATTFLLFRIGVWKAFQSILVIISVIMATRMITYKNGKNKALVALIIWLCIYIMNIWVSREVLYWLDGGLAYELTAFQIFAYFYYLYTRMHLKISKKYDKILLPVVAFFAGWSSAQSGAMVIVIPLILVIWQKIIKKEKIEKIYYVSMIIGIIGYGIFFFAPGNYARMDKFNEFAELNLLQKINYRVDDVIGLIFNLKKYPFTGIPFFMFLTVGLTAVIGLNFIKKEKNRKIKNIIYITSIVQILFIIVCLGIAIDIPYTDILTKYTLDLNNIYELTKNGKLVFEDLIPYIVLIGVLISNLLEAFIIGLKKQNPMLVITVMSGLLMQGVMVMAPGSAYRTTYYTIMFLWFAIAYLINIAKEEKISIIMIPILIFTMYNFQLGLTALITYFIMKPIVKNLEKDMQKCEIIIILIFMLLISWGNYKTTIDKYAINRKIYQENISRIEQFKKRVKNGSNEKELNLLLPKDDLYGFTPMVGTDWVESDLKQYFSIEKDVELKVERNEE